MKVTKCKSCGRDITWIKTTRGRVMPCDYPAVDYQKNERSKDIIVLENGEVIHGTVVKHNLSNKLQMVVDGQGYISHFATCPNAAQFRKN